MLKLMFVIKRYSSPP